MSPYRLTRSRKEQVQIWITVWIVLALSGFRLFVEMRPRIDLFFAAYTEFPVAIVALNALFFWLLFLLWIAYRRWRESILSEQELEQVLMSISPDALIVVNRDRVITMCSGQVQAMFGLSEKEILNKKTDMLYYDRRLQGKIGEIASRLEEFGFHVGYATGKRRDGTTFPLEIITGKIRFQQGAVILMRDITERCRIEDALRESEVRFEQFMRYFPGFAFIKDQDGRRIYLNDAHAVERGWNIGDCIGCKDEDLYREDLARQCRESDLRVLQEGKAVRYVTRITEPDGNVCSLLTVKFPLPVTADGHSQRMIAGLSLDITEQEAAERERIRIEKQLQQAQKLESLGVLAGGIAHDFNNLIMGMMGHADLALNDYESGENVQHHVHAVIESCQRATDLANQLLAYSGKGRFVLAPTNLSEVIEDLRNLLMVSLSKKAVLDFDLAAGLPDIECDVTQIRQVLMNLMVNASDALESRAGTISLQTGKVSVRANDPVIAASLALGQQPLVPGDYVFAKISDTGVGIREEDRAKIFDPFYTTKRTGHGLGLAAALGIVRSHGGCLTVESEVGKGTVCSLYLPVSNKVAAIRRLDKDLHESWNGEGTVLLADDEEMVREVAAMMLESIGFTVVSVSDGRQALDCYQQEKGKFRALILDISMPSLGGVEVCQKLRQDDERVPVILSSGYNQWQGIEDLPQEDRIYFLKKPYRLRALRDMMREVLLHE